MMAVQGQQEHRARSHCSCPGKGLWHPDGFQPQLRHQSHLFRAFLEKQKQEQRPKPASLLPCPPSVSLAVIWLSILSVSKLGILEGNSPTGLIFLGEGLEHPGDGLLEVCVGGPSDAYTPEA